MKKTCVVLSLLIIGCSTLSRPRPQWTLEKARAHLERLGVDFERCYIAIGELVHPEQFYTMFLNNDPVIAGGWTDRQPVASFRVVGSWDNLSPLEHLPVGSIYLVDGKARDLSPLKGNSLHSVSLLNTQISDLTPLKGMPISYLQLEGKKISDLAPLRGMPLNLLAIWNSSVRDISPLRGAPIDNLTLCGDIEDLSPLLGMPLTKATIDDTKVRDLSPLGKSPLEILTFPINSVTAGIDVVRSIPTLQEIGPNITNTMPASDFWKKYDAGDFKIQGR